MKVITSLIGKGDLIEQPDYNCEYIAFAKYGNGMWQTRKPCNKFKNNALNAKIHKILTHKYLNDDIFMWIDGDIKLTADPEELVEIMGDKNFLFFKHPTRDCLFDEAKDCIRIGRGDKEDITEQYEDYYELPRHAGLIESAVFLRRNNPEANALMEKWWIEICRYSSRDQISWLKVFLNKDYILLDNFLNNKYYGNI